MGPTAVEDAWQWLPLKARLTLVHFLSSLPQLAAQLSTSPDNRASLGAALHRLTVDAELTPSERNALKLATELVTCGEEVSQLVQSGSSGMCCCNIVTAFVASTPCGT